MKPGIPVATGAGDNMGSTLGAGAATPGDAVLTIGTSGVACIVDHAFHPGPAAAILASAHAAPDTFLSMGVVMSATASLDWTARLGGTTAAQLAADAATLDATQIVQAPVFLSRLIGIRTPLNRPGMMGRIEEPHPGVDRAMPGYATKEGVAFQIADCVAAQRAAGAIPQRFLAVGGGTKSELWVRLLASALGEPIGLPEGADLAGPAGAARLARVAAGADIATLAEPLPLRHVVDPDPGLTDILVLRKIRFDALQA